MLPRVVLRTFSKTSYVLLIVLIIVTTGLSCAALLSQAVRTSPQQSWRGNVNALVIGLSYAVVLAVSLLYYVNRRIAVRRKLHRIRKASGGFGMKDMPDSVHKYVTREYVRCCLIAYESLPTDADHPGWGRPGTKYSGVRFSKVLLDTIPQVETLARAIIPNYPVPRPRARMLHQFRFILPLLLVDEDGLTPLHYYDAAVQIARSADVELTEEEFEVGMQAASEIEQSLEACRLEMSEGSTTQLGLGI